MLSENMLSDTLVMVMVELYGVQRERAKGRDGHNYMDRAVALMHRLVVEARQ